MADSAELVHHAIDLSNAGDHSGAIDLLTTAVRLDANNYQAWFERGMALLNLDKDADAIADFDRALAINPVCPGTMEWRSKAFAALGQYQAAADDLLKALQAHSEGPHPGTGASPLKWADCAEAFVKAGSHQKARELLENYFAHFADRVSMYACYETAPLRLLARLLMQQGDLTRACSLADRAYQSKHQCPADVLNYALVLEAAGDLARANDLCAEALKLNDRDAVALALRQRLASR